MAKIDIVLEEATKRGASDLHVAAARPPFARVKGELVALADSALAAKEVEELLIELLTPPQRARLGVEQSVRFAHATASGRYRGEIVHALGGLRAAFRSISPRVPALAELGCPEVVWRFADRRSGLVIVSGPSGSGKSTTLAAMVDHVNKTRACHILTIEEPIELVHEAMRSQVTQREIGTHVPDAAVALRNATRENADVVLVSSLAKKDTLEEALRVANAGVLVLAGMRANGVVPAVDCLLGLLDERGRSSFADVLGGVVAQQLVNGAPVHEVLTVTPAVTAALRANDMRELSALLKNGQGQGMIAMDAALERLVKAGKLGAEVAWDLAADKESFAQWVGRKETS